MELREYKIMEAAHRKMWSDLASNGRDYKPSEVNSIHYKCTACQVAINTLGKREGRCVCCPVTEWRLRAIANPHRYYENTPCIAKDAGGADIFHRWEHCSYPEVRKELAALIRDMEWSYISAYDTATLDPHAIHAMSVYTGITTPYIDQHKASGIKVGDWVKVTRKCADYEKGWGNAWNPHMDKYVGNIYQVDEDWDESGFYIRYPDRGAYHFPYFVLEKVEESCVKKEPEKTATQKILEKYRSTSGTVDGLVEDIIAYIDEKTSCPF